MMKRQLIEMIRNIIKEEKNDDLVSSSDLKRYKDRYTYFVFSTDTDMYGNQQLVVDIPKRRQQVKLYKWNGKINAQVTNGGLYSNYNSIDSALDHLYQIYGQVAPKFKNSKLF